METTTYQGAGTMTATQLENAAREVARQLIAEGFDPETACKAAAAAALKKAGER